MYIPMFVTYRVLGKWEELTDLQLTLQRWMSGARGAVCDDIMDIAIAKEQQVIIYHLITEYLLFVFDINYFVIINMSCSSCILSMRNSNISQLCILRNLYVNVCTRKAYVVRQWYGLHRLLKNLLCFCV